MSTHPALALEQINVTLPDGRETLTILGGTDLRVGPGEVVRLTGASGSGKSTLLAVGAPLRIPHREASASMASTPPT